MQGVVPYLLFSILRTVWARAGHKFFEKKSFRSLETPKFSKFSSIAFLRSAMFRSVHPMPTFLETVLSTYNIMN